MSRAPSSSRPARRHRYATVDRAIRSAIGERKVAAIILPNDLQEAPYSEPPRTHGAVLSGIGYSRPKIVPYDADLQRAAEVLNAGRKVAILVGAGALQATDEVIAVAETLGAGVAKALLGKAAVPDDLPWVTGAIGLLGTEPSYKLMNECDTLLMIGSGFPYSEFLPEEGQARGVQIDLKPDMLSIRYPMEVNLHGEAGETLRALLPLLEKKSDRSWQQQVEAWRADWDRTLEERAMAAADPINPQRVAWELSPRLPERAIITSDSGSCANWYARDIRMRRGMMGSLSGGLASMGAAVPYAIAAKFAHPDRPVVALVGDGAMQMNNMAELITVAKYWSQWQNHQWICCVFNNQDLNQVTWEQRDGGRSEIRGFAESARRAVSPLRRADRAAGHLLRPRGPVAAAWEQALPPIARCCWSFVPIPTCRRCRRTSSWSRPRPTPRCCCMAIRTSRHHQADRQAGARLDPAGHRKDKR